VNVLFIEDQVLFREGVKMLLGSLAPKLGASLSIWGTGTIRGALQYALRDVGLILMDWHLPDMSGEVAVQRLRAAFPSARIAVLSGDEDPRLIHRAIEAGASGFITKTASADILVAALRRVLSGEVYLPPHALPPIPNRLRGDNPPRQLAPGRLEGLSERQSEVLLLAVQGVTNRQIATDLMITEATVKSHLSTAYKILDVSNRTEAVYAAARLGLGRPYLE
jgi:DNA-binding NarL/FixJ family response regulator